MNKKISVSLTVVLLISSILFTGSLWAAEEASPVALTILKKTKELLEPTRPSIRKVVVTLREDDKKTVEKVMGQAYKMFPDGKKMLLVMLEPAHVKGLGYLLMEREKEDDVAFTYIPSMRRTNKIIGFVDRHASFFGTDYTYSDLGFIDLKGDYRILEEEKYEGKAAYKVEEKFPAKPIAYYSKIISWVAKASMLPLKREYYAPSGKLWKVELFEDITVVGGVPTAMRRIMKDVQQNTSTELSLQELQYCGTLADVLFDPGNLANVALDPVWQPYCTLPGATE
jgi:hypothetical protein